MKTLLQLALVTLLLSQIACSEPAKEVAPPQAAVTAPEKTQEKTSPVEAAKEIALEDTEPSYGPVHFSYDSTELDQSSRNVLDQLAKHLTSHRSVTILIAGHCDERGTAEYNLSLGEQRAKTVRKYLTHLGVGAERLDTVSFGKAQPLTNDHDEQALAKNRRAELSPRR